MDTPLKAIILSAISNYILLLFACVVFVNVCLYQRTNAKADFSLSHCIAEFYMSNIWISCLHASRQCSAVNSSNHVDSFTDFYSCNFHSCHQTNFVTPFPSLYIWKKKKLAKNPVDTKHNFSSLVCILCIYTAIGVVMHQIRRSWWVPYFLLYPYYYIALRYGDPAPSSKRNQTS